MRPLLVVGSINVDISVRVPRLTEPGETLLGRDLYMSPGGKGANQAHAARLDGASVRLVGAVGRDSFGAVALQSLQDRGVGLAAVRRLVDATTGVALIQVADDGDNSVALAAGANEMLKDWQLERLVDAATWASHDLLLQWELLPESSMRAASLARAAGSRVTLNLAPARLLHLLQPELVDWCLVNEGELAALARHLGLPAGLHEAARALAQRVGQGVIVTMGSRGVFACERAPDPEATQPGRVECLPPEGVHLAAHAVAAVDTTGAGDTFCGVWAAALAAGCSTLQALQRANAAAALSCRRRGAQAAQPTRQEIDALLAQCGSTPPTAAVPALT